MEYTIQISQLLREIDTITQSYQLVTKATGEDFNIFSVLNIETDEERTHSRFIAELLNEKGSHGMGNVFMEMFLDNLSITDFEIKQGYDIYTEYYAGKISGDKDKGGRIDILIRNKNNEIILIENKIYAGEQEKQLLRYSNSFPSTKNLLFLTLYGTESECKHSKRVKYKPVSYANDIINWLEDCIKEAVNTPILRESIYQYIHLIKKLTGQNLNKQMSKDIVSRVLRDRESLEAYIQLNRVKHDIYKRVVQETVIPLLKDIAHKYSLDLKSINEEALINHAGVWQTIQYENEKLRNLNLSISFAFNTQKKIAKEFIFGLAYLDMNNKHVRKEYEQIIEQFDLSLGKGMKSEHWLRWSNYTNYSDWTNLDVLKRIQFKDFENDISIKVEKMLAIFDDL